MKRTIKRNANADEILIKEAFNDFMDAKVASNLSKSTLRNYEQSCGFFFKYYEMDDDYVCSQINEKMIYQWINHLRNTDISPSAINHYIRDVRAFLYWCMGRDYIEDFKIKCIEQQEEPPKFYDEDELELLLEKPRKQDSFVDWRTWTIISFILATGARPQTVITLKVNDIDFVRKEITYRHMKTKQAMIVPLSSGLESVLKEYVRMWRTGGEWLFPNVGDEPLTANGLRLSFVRYCQKRGVEKTNIYGLRHTFARGWVKANGNTFALQKMLGHADISMTKRYVALYSEDLKKDLEDFTVLDKMRKSKSRTNKIERKQL